MKIAIVGSRDFKDMDFASNVIMRELIFSIPTKDNDQDLQPIIVSGGAKGIDSLAEKVAKMNRVDTKIFLPDWDLYGKRAGFLRNKLIIDYSDRVIAFWDGKSKGTKHSIDLTLKTNKPLDIYVR